MLRTAKIRVDTTVVSANVAYPTDSGLLARAVKPDRDHRQADPGRGWRGPHQAP